MPIEKNSSQIGLYIRHYNVEVRSGFHIVYDSAGKWGFPMAKFINKKNDTKITVIVIAFAVLLIAAIVALVLLFPSGRQQEEQPVTTEQTEPTAETAEEEVFPFVIPGFTRIEDVPEVIVDEQLCIIGAGSYTGPYYEDGSDENVTNVLAIVVENIREGWVVNADLVVSCGEKIAEFSVSALPGHRCALLLEKNRLTYTEGATITDPICTFCANDMTGMTEDFSADFSLEPYEGNVLVLQNVSGHEIAGDAMLYYKNVAPYGVNGELLYLGGIAYTYRFEGPFSADAMQQATPPHYTIGGSAILFMSYDS